MKQKFETRVTEGVVVIELHGQMIDYTEAVPLYQEVMHLVESGQRLFVINMQDCSYFSMGNYGAIGHLVKIFTSLQRNNGRLALAALPKRTMEGIKRLKLDAVFDIFPDEMRAIDFHRKRREISPTVQPCNPSSI